MDIDSKFNNHMHYKTHLFCNDDKFFYLDRTAQLVAIHYGSLYCGPEITHVYRLLNTYPLYYLEIYTHVLNLNSETC